MENADTEIVEQKPLTPSERFLQFQANKAAALTPEGIAKAAADKAAAAGEVAAPVVEKRRSGDERKFKNIEKRFNQSFGRLQEKIDQALAAKPGAAPDAATVVATPGAAPKRGDFASDEAFADAKTAHMVQKALEKKVADEEQAKEIRDTLAGYNDRMAKAPEKYPDWAEVLAAGTGGALSVDLGKECPALFWAIAKSPYNDDCFYEWLKDSKKLQNLIDIYKSGPKGEVEALTAFHRFEGRVGKDPKDAKAEVKVERKADDAVVPKPKPKPSAETSIRGGTAAPDGKPALYLPGTHTMSPAYKTWLQSRRAA